MAQLDEALPELTASRQQAVLATLGHLGPSATKPLEKWIESQDQECRTAALDGLRQMGVPAAPVFVRARSSPHADVREAARTSLTALGTAAVEPFAELGDDQRIELAEIGMVEGYAEALTPLESGDTLALQESGGTGLWITVWIPVNAPAGEHTATLKLTPTGGNAIEVPLNLHVFDFELPPQAHFGTQINVGIAGLVPEGGTVDDASPCSTRYSSSSGSGSAW